MLADEHLELGDQLTVPAELELGGGQHLPGDEPQLLEAGAVGSGGGDVVELRPRAPTPQRQPVAHQVDRACGPAEAQCLLGGPLPVLEVVDVDRGPGDAQGVSGRSLRERSLEAGPGHPPAQV